MGMKPVCCGAGLLAAGLLLTGCESTNSQKATARTPPPVRPYASTNTTPGAGRSAWDNNPPPTPNTTASVGPVGPAGANTPSAKNDGYGPPLTSYQNNTRTAQGSEDTVRLTAPTRGLAEAKPQLPRDSEQASVSPPPPDPPITDSKSLTPPSPPSFDGNPRPSAPPSLQTPDGKPPLK